MLDAVDACLDGFDHVPAVRRHRQAETMRFVSLMPKNTSIPEMIITPTNIRPYTPTETGLTAS